MCSKNGTLGCAKIMDWGMPGLMAPTTINSKDMALPPMAAAKSRSQEPRRMMYWDNADAER